MAYRLTEDRLAALRTAAEHPKGSIDARTVSKADELALEALGLAASIDDCGHVQGADDPEGVHRSHPHFFRITDAGRRAAESAGTGSGGGPDNMPSTDTTEAAVTGESGLALLAELAELQRESDRLLVATTARIAYDELAARDVYLQTHGTSSKESETVRAEFAEYQEGRRAVPPQVDPADVIAHQRRRIDVFGRLAEAGVEGAAEGLAEAEAQLAEELRKAPPAVELVSFGYLHGAPPEAHLVVDMREHFRDPHVNPALRELTADHELVMRTVFDTEGVPELAAGIRAAVDAFRAGPSGGTVRVAVGCAGGRHRSAAMVNYLAMQWRRHELNVATEHRDIHRPVVER
jgi:UPF0042 nucleotide-binding protein